MTVTYSHDVATSSFGCFIKLFARWRASIYKLIWSDVLIFMLIYYGIHCIYRFMLHDSSQRVFEEIVLYCASSSSLIPLTFVLGFFVSIIVKRWWDQYLNLPWVDPIGVLVCALIHANDSRGRIMRFTIMRYVCACSTMMFRNIAPAMKKRFPSLDKLVEYGLLDDTEMRILDKMQNKFPKLPMYWMPIVWASDIVTKARLDGHIRDDFSVKSILDKIDEYRNFCMRLTQYDAITIPLLYTQVVTVVVYSYFVGACFAHQWTVNKKDEYHILQGAQYVPLFLLMEFIFYMGWLKVAECLICPFGEDDDDFELNWFIDRNFRVSKMMVDDDDHPDLAKDQYWDEVLPVELPYPNDQSLSREEPPLPSQSIMSMGANLSDTQNSLWQRWANLQFSRSSMSGKMWSSQSPEIDVERGIEFNYDYTYDLDKITSAETEPFRYHSSNFPDEALPSQSMLEHFSSEREITSNDSISFETMKERSSWEALVRQNKRLMFPTMDSIVKAELKRQARSKRYLARRRNLDEETIEEVEEEDFGEGEEEA